MVRSYQRHEPTSAFALVSSNAANGVLDADGKTAFLPALEDVLVWDVKLGQQTAMWHEIGVRTAVTAIARAPYPHQKRFAVGYADGAVRIWDEGSRASTLTLNGHQKAVTSLAFDAQGMYLASGSQDTSIIMWDIVAETGLFRLRGHHDVITGLHMLGDGLYYLVSASKDGLLKLWDLRMQHNVETVVSGDEQLWSLAVSERLYTQTEGSDAGSSGPLVVTGGSNGQVRFWEVSAAALEAGLDSKPQFIAPHGSITLPSSQRVSQLSFCAPTGDSFLAAASGDKAVNVLRVRTLEEARKKQQRRAKRAKEKGREVATPDVALTWALRIEMFMAVRPSQGRVRSFSFPTGGEPAAVGTGPVPLLLALSSNAAEIYSVPPPPRSRAEKEEQLEPRLAYSLELPGHRSDVRALALSSDDTLLASVCGSAQLKIWNVRTGRCIRTLPVAAYALSVTWLPGDRYVLVGCKDGSLHTYDVPAGMLVESLSAHDGPVWSVIVHPNGLSAVTCSADKDVKFWDFEMVDGEQDGGEAPSAQRLSLVHVRTLKLTDDVLCARFSPDGRLLAVSLLDNTVKVFYADSLKFFLSLYGHKLPVLSLDISGDSRLCVTCSADKNVKIWGLDFGDCHKSIFAHDDSIMGVAFEKGTQGGGLMGGREGASHRFWTVSKDGLVKYWDGDRFVGIQTLEGHHSEVWALATGHTGSLVVTSGADRSIRTWEKTDEPLFIEEEREKELEKMYDSAAVANEDRQIGELAADGTPVARQEATAVSKSSTETLMAGERLLEAIEIADADIAQRAAADPRAGPIPTHPMIAAAFGPDSMEEPDAAKYVLRVVEKILPAHLEDALLVLPFDRVVSLMRYVDTWVAHEWNVALAARVLFFLLRTYHAQIVSNRVLRTNLVDLRRHLQGTLNKQKTMIGFNLAALRYIRQQEISRRTTELFEDPRTSLEDLDEHAVRAKIEERAAAKRKRKLVVR
ncbi:beta transducin [Malassezia cuniculi]|uniref:Beta transducin n=1 Tax=Malassezia cuniculi TaxID=948313 RepID=A0AAF0EV17_9BASI|nr:beta transducin [Malassezia cuniculi]